MKILAAVDGSPFTKRMLAYLAAHDEWLGAQHEYTLFTAVPAVPPRAAAVLDKEVLKSHYEDEAEKVFKPMRTFFTKQGIKASFVAKVGIAGRHHRRCGREGQVRPADDGLARPRLVRQPGAGLGGHQGAGQVRHAGAADPLKGARGPTDRAVR